jgi:MFS family permease
MYPLAPVAAPSLQRGLHVSGAAPQLIVGGYAFMYASGTVTGGRLGDLVGYRRMFMIGVLSFAAASLLCGLAQTSAAGLTLLLPSGSALRKAAPEARPVPAATDAAV